MSFYVGSNLDWNYFSDLSKPWINFKENVIGLIGSFSELCKLNKKAEDNLLVYYRAIKLVFSETCTVYVLVRIFEYFSVFALLEKKILVMRTAKVGSVYNF